MDEKKLVDEVDEYYIFASSFTGTAGDMEHPISIEELYQAIKGRLQRELHEAINDPIWHPDISWEQVRIDPLYSETNKKAEK